MAMYEDERIIVSDFYNKIVKEMGEDYLYAPIKIELSLTDSCNQKCQHCSNGFKINKRNNYFNILHLHKLFTCNPFMFILSGGEPLLHPQFIEIVTTIKKFGSFIRVLTNGTLITEPLIHKLVNAGWSNGDVIQISLDACDENTYKKQRGTPDLNKVIESIFLLTKNNIQVDVHTVPTKINKNQILEIYDLASAYGAFSFSGAPLAPFDEKSFDLMCSANELEVLHRKIIEKSKNKKTLYFGGIDGELCSNQSLLELINNTSSYSQMKPKSHKYKCSAGRAICYIDENGYVYPCVFLQRNDCCLGNINFEDLKEIWFKDKLNDFRKGFSIKGTNCDSCQFWNICNGGCIGVSSSRLSNIKPGYDMRCYKLR